MGKTESLKKRLRTLLAIGLILLFFWTLYTDSIDKNKDSLPKNLPLPSTIPITPTDVSIQSIPVVPWFTPIPIQPYWIENA